jgi:hypothetical protein
MMASYLLLLKPSYDGVIVDSMLDVTSAITDQPFKEWMASAKVFDRMVGGTEAEKEKLQVLRDAQYIQLRSKFDGDGPYVLHCDEKEFTRDELQQYLRDNPKVLKRLREGSRI